MKTWKFNVRLSVADSWIVDGFDLKDRVEEIEEMLQGLLPYAYGHEINVNVNITKSPDSKTINDLQDGTTEPKD